MPDVDKGKPFSAVSKKATIGPQMKLPVDSLQIEQSPPTYAMINAIMLRPFPLISLPLFDIIDYYCSTTTAK